MAIIFRVVFAPGQRHSAHDNNMALGMEGMVGGALRQAERKRQCPDTERRDEDEQQAGGSEEIRDVAQRNYAIICAS